MPRSEGYARSMADLLMAEGAARADAARQKGAIWGSTMQSLGQIPGQVMGMRREEQDRTAAAEDRTLRRETLTAQQQAAQLERAMQVAELTGRTLGSAQSQAEWDAGLEALRQVPGIPVNQIPKMYSPALAKSVFAQTQAAQQQIAAAARQGPVSLSPGARLVDPNTGEMIAEGGPVVRPPVSVGPGARLVNPETGSTVAEGGARAPVSVGPGARLVNPETGAVVAEGGPRPPVSVGRGGRLIDPDTGRVVAEGAPPADDTGRPYIIPVQTAQGIVPFNTRTGQFIDADRRDLKPGETAQREIANAQTTATILKQVIGSIDEKSLGPIIGRYKTVEAALAGNDPTFATFSAGVSTLQNTVINLRTGAQMSEPEARRILNEVPDVKLPPATFIAKAKQAEKYFQEWLKNRANVAYGRTTTQDVDRMVAPPESGEFDFDPATGQLVPRGGR